MIRTLKLFPLLLAIIGVAACGQSGALYMPEPAVVQGTSEADAQQASGQAVEEEPDEIAEQLEHASQESSKNTKLITSP